ncbi:hypothetical protein AYO37_01010 [Opitutia bacterium SCGC AG-212-L18]|nr:hypothetical protein AYO37_01010 [Opitutae bacterium SCGC AG-212-L18]
MKQDCRFGSIVRKLMDNRGIKAAELARQIDMPHTTITRIITGNTDNPSAKTLLSLSEFFNVSLDYLIGKEIDHKSSVDFYQTENSPEYIPLIGWDSLKNWEFQKKEILSKNKKIAVSCKVSSKAFALPTEKAYGKTIFPKGSILIVDPDFEYNENDYVVVSINKNFPTIREVCEDSGKYYLNPIGLNLPSIELEPEHVVFGKIIECRILFYSNTDRRCLV